MYITKNRTLVCHCIIINCVTIRIVFPIWMNGTVQIFSDLGWPFNLTKSMRCKLEHWFQKHAWRKTLIFPLMVKSFVSVNHGYVGNRYVHLRWTFLFSECVLQSFEVIWLVAAHLLSADKKMGGAPVLCRIDYALCVYYRVRGRFTQSKSHAKTAKRIQRAPPCYFTHTYRKCCLPYCHWFKQFGFANLLNGGNQFLYGSFITKTAISSKLVKKNKN